MPRLVPEELTRACFGDPALAIEKQEEKTCAGCCYAGIKLEGKAVPVCRYGKPYGKRCGQYLGRDD